MTADFVLRSGRFTTLDRSNPTATAVAITDGRFTAVGRDEDVMPLAGASTRMSAHPVRCATMAESPSADRSTSRSSGIGPRS
jgi:predicted amidohydrolase YtcJ